MHNVEGHGYVSLLDIISHLLSFSNKCTAAHIKDYVTETCEGGVVTELSQSRAVQSIIERAAMVCGDEKVILLMCYEWSDDFDPALSTKASWKSCWVKTATIMSCNSFDKVHPENATFAIAVGNKKSIHQEIEL